MLFLVIISSLLSFSQGLAAPKKLAGEAAGKAAYSNLCELKFANFEKSVAERRAAERPVYDQEARIRARSGVFTAIKDEDNAAFVRIAKAANRGQSKLWFLDLENAVLKILNDKVVQDKDLVTALTNLHKDVVWRTLSEDPEIAAQIVGKYSDFKSVRLAFKEMTPELERRIENKLFEVNRRYSDYLEKLAVKNDWAKRAKGLASDRRAWYHSGIDTTPDEAGILARESRNMPGPARLRRRADGRAALLNAAADAGQLQRWVAKRFAKAEGMLVGDPAVLSAEAIEAIRKISPKDESGVIPAIQETLRLRFKVATSAKDAEALKRYLDAADRFSPGLLLEQRVVIDMGKEAAGVISADFKGQNARNLEETLKALARTEGQDLSLRIRAVRAGEEIATQSLDEKKARFQAVLDRLVPGIKGEFTGDDGIGFLQKPLSKEQKKRFAQLWVESGGKPEDLRLTFENFRYVDTGKSIPPEARSMLVVEAEGIEKKLRTELIRILPREQLNGLHIAVSLKGREEGKNSAEITLSTGDSLPAKLRAQVRKIVEASGSAVDLVEINRLDPN